MMLDKEHQNIVEIGTKLAIALLKKRKQISLEEIEAIPFITDIEANLIFDMLSQIFNVEVVTIKKKDKPFLEWTKILKLKENTP